MNKKLFLIILISAPLNVTSTEGAKHNEDCDLDICSEWKNLDSKEERYIEKFGGRWILAGKFTFKNRSKETVPLTELDLEWKGKQKIVDLEGSLFKKEPNKEFIPVQEFLISDGRWNTEKQTLQLRFNQKEYLGVSTTFYLVLTVSPSLEKKLKDGYFTVMTDKLPKQLKKTVTKRRPILSISPQEQHKQRKNRLAYGIKRK